MLFHYFIVWRRKNNYQIHSIDSWEWRHHYFRYFKFAAPYFPRELFLEMHLNSMLIFPTYVGEGCSWFRTGFGGFFVALPVGAIASRRTERGDFFCSVFFFFFLFLDVNPLLDSIISAWRSNMGLSYATKFTRIRVLNVPGLLHNTWEPRCWILMPVDSVTLTPETEIWSVNLQQTKLPAGSLSTSSNNTLF